MPRLVHPIVGLRLELGFSERRALILIHYSLIVKVSPGKLHSFLCCQAISLGLLTGARWP